MQRTSFNIHTVYIKMLVKVNINNSQTQPRVGNLRINTELLYIIIRIPLYLQPRLQTLGHASYLNLMLV